MEFVTFKYLKIVLSLFVVLVEKSLSVKCIPLETLGTNQQTGGAIERSVELSN